MFWSNQCKTFFVIFIQCSQFASLENIFNLAQNLRFESFYLMQNAKNKIFIEKIYSSIHLIQVSVNQIIKIELDTLRFVNFF